METGSAAAAAGARPGVPQHVDRPESPPQQLQPRLAPGLQCPATTEHRLVMGHRSFWCRYYWWRRRAVCCGSVAPIRRDTHSNRTSTSCKGDGASSAWSHSPCVPASREAPSKPYLLRGTPSSTLAASREDDDLHLVLREDFNNRLESHSPRVRPLQAEHSRARRKPRRAHSCGFAQRRAAWARDAAPQSLWKGWWFVVLLGRRRRGPSEPSRHRRPQAAATTTAGCWAS